MYWHIYFSPLSFILDSDQYPKKVDFHQPLKKRPPDLRRIDDSVYDPYFWEHRGDVPRRRQHQTTVRRHDSNFRFPGKGTSYRRHEVALHPNHNYNPHQVPIKIRPLSRPPYKSVQVFNPNYNPQHTYKKYKHTKRRKDSHRLKNGGKYHRRKQVTFFHELYTNCSIKSIRCKIPIITHHICLFQQTFQETFTYHNPLTKVPASQFATTQNSPSSGIFGSLLKLAGFGDKSENTGYYQNHNQGYTKPGATKGGIFSLLLGSSKKDDIQCNIF